MTSTKRTELEKSLAKNRAAAADAIEKMGGPAEASRKLSSETDTVALGVVWAWINRDKRGIPLEYLKEVEVESGISRKTLRQDVPWP